MVRIPLKTGFSLSRKCLFLGSLITVFKCSCMKVVFCSLIAKKSVRNNTCCALKMNVISQRERCFLSPKFLYSAQYNWHKRGGGWTQLLCVCFWGGCWLLVVGTGAYEIWMGLN